MVATEVLLAGVGLGGVVALIIAGYYWSLGVSDWEWLILGIVAIIFFVLYMKMR